MKRQVVYTDKCWRVCHNSQDQIIVQFRTLGIWQDWTEQICHDCWVTVPFPDYESAIDFIHKMQE